MAIDTDAEDLGHLDPAIQKVEFKITVLAGRGSHRCRPCFTRRAANRSGRKVYFYDTKDLALYGKNLVLRARVTQGDDDDSTVKLRPVDLATTKPAGGRSTESGSSSTWWATSRSAPQSSTESRIAARSRRSRRNSARLGSLFSGKQEQLIADVCAADGISLHELEVLGPVDARKWDLDNPEGFPHTLSCRGVVPAGRDSLHRALVQGFLQRSAGRGTGVPCAARPPEDRPRRRSRPEDSQGPQVLRRAIAVGPIVAAREETYATIASA